MDKTTDNMSSVTTPPSVIPQTTIIAILIPLGVIAFIIGIIMLPIIIRNNRRKLQHNNVIIILSNQENR
jgi:hypothetical protein